MIIPGVVAGSYQAAGGGGTVPESIANLICWWDADNLSGYSDGDTISSWANRVSGSPALACLTTPYPIYTASWQNGLAAVDHGRPASDSLMKAAGPFSGADPGGIDITLFAVMQTLETSQTARVVTFGDTTTAPVWAYGPDSSYRFNNGYLPISTDPAAPTIYRMIKHGSLFDCAYNGVLQLQDASYTNTTGIADEFWIGDIDTGHSDAQYGEILIYDRQLNTSEISTIESYLSNKWAIAI